MTDPLYPQIHVHTESGNPIALVAAVRQAMRQAHCRRSEIERFSLEALSRDRNVQRVCIRWVCVDSCPCQ
jgi:hypothetical protein